MIYTLTLNPSVDYHMTLSHLSEGTLNRAKAASVHFGGKGINVSRVLRELGQDSVAMGFAAGFTGEALLAHLQKTHVETDFVRLPAGMTRINVKMSDKDASETEINAPGPTITPDDMASMEGKLAHIGTGDTVVMAGRLPAGLPADTYARLALSLSRRGARVVADVSGEALRAILASHPFLIKPNLPELEELVGRSLHREDGSPDLSLVGDAAEACRAAGAANVLVTLGAFGAYLLDEHGCAHTRPSPMCPSPSDGVVNTIGAGDSAVAGFLAGLAAECDYAHALRLAVAAGYATAHTEGLATGDMIDAVIARMV